MSNRPSTKIATTITTLLHSRASAPPPHAPPRSPPTPKRLLPDQHPIILKGLRDHGSDRVWPHSVNDDIFFTDTKRIATETSTDLSLPLPVVQEALFSMMWPRMLPFLATIEGNLPKKNKRPCKSKALKALRYDDISYQRYSVYKGESKFSASRIAALPRPTEYEEFRVMLRDIRPKGFAGDPEEMGGFRFKALWSMDGVLWTSVGNEEGFRKLYLSCLEHEEEEEITVLFLQDHPVMRSTVLSRRLRNRANSVC